MKFIVEDVLCVLGDAHHLPQGNIQRAAQDQWLGAQLLQDDQKDFEVGPFLGIEQSPFI